MFFYPFEVDGVLTRVLQAGRAGPPIVLVHGLSARADRWRRNIDALAAHGFTVYAIDLPGHGFAAKGRGFDYSAAGYADFLRNVLDALGIARAALVGTSFGGLVVSSFAALHPERVHTLVMAGAIGLVPVGEERRLATTAWLKDMTRAGIRARLERSVVDKTLITEDLVDEDQRINTSPGAAEAFAEIGRYYATRLDEDATSERLAAVAGRFPILLLWGEQDISVARTYGEETARRVAGARLVVVPEAGHLPYYEQSATVNRLLLDTIAAREFA